MTGQSSIKVEPLLLGFSHDSSGELFLLVGRANARGDALPVKLVHGDRVKEIYKELTDEELKL